LRASPVGGLILLAAVKGFMEKVEGYSKYPLSENK
jgi:hypothetical protein